MPDPTNTQISMNVAIAVLHTYDCRSKDLSNVPNHYKELAETLIQCSDHDAVHWAKEVLDVD